ncbi:uncharacterized protein L201_003527 [Kwoniella dendrophila CBS 6074]|uniref:Uncharacterized protein n=1 Tax=Kwoniella dendrophila CBS 6074 TaxID=1295534 RepID=A0AAX4JUY6_9TREE
MIYNPLVSTTSMDNHGIIRFTNPTGSKGWRNLKDDTWGIEDCLGFSIWIDQKGNIHVDQERQRQKFLEPQVSNEIENQIQIPPFGQDQYYYITRRNWFTSINKDDDKDNYQINFRYCTCFLIVRSKGDFCYQDTKMNFTHIDAEGKVIFQDVYIPKRDREAIRLEKEKRDQEEEENNENLSSRKSTKSNLWKNLNSPTELITDTATIVQNVFGIVTVRVKYMIIDCENAKTSKTKIGNLWVHEPIKRSNSRKITKSQTGMVSKTKHFQ